MDPLTRDVGFDMLCDTIVARAAQLQKLETDSCVDRKTHIYNLQRKVRWSNSSRCVMVLYIANLWFRNIEGATF